MQKLFATLCSLILITNVAKADTGPFQDGMYYSPELGLEILVEKTPNYLRIKGLSNERKWQKFRIVERNTWRDYRGNVIVRGKRSQLIFHSANRRYDRKLRIVHFYKSRERFRNRNDQNYYNDRSGTGHGSSSYNFNNSDVYGKWYSNDFSLNMYIEPFQNGIRTRLENENSWTEYRKSQNDDYWEDKNGNKLLREKDGSLYWQSKNGRRKISLKRSDN